ncbi:CDP-alcohol phosphatidyltransferase family protein [Acidicapsa dinghuensis]|uniref:CDP-alcohol phosphatidyltransferase family protein n=1 Tax=Acidicapsa dinghuensis TaxID=2218256 RepID=A0ABW1EG54_9BACT|nr:phosphatidylcholine/phosphatidylserine synthase [Acidicapsa dinghuensis]
MNSPFVRLDKEQRAARVRRGMFLLPSLFTAGSIGAGYIAITQTLDSVNATGSVSAAQHLDWAAIAICIAIPFDSLDGRIARLTNTASDFGKELDSLADAITFGVAPSLLAFVWGFRGLSTDINPDLRRTLLQIGSFVCFLFLLCGVSRLARFNTSNNPKPRNPGRLDRKYFVGMPIPAAAGMIATTVHFCYGYPVPYGWFPLLWAGLVGLLGFLMVSTWRFWSGKEINLSSRQPFQLLVLLAIVLFIVFRFSSGALFILTLVYMFSGIWARAAYSWSRRRRQMPRSQGAGTVPAFASEYEQMVHNPGQEEDRDASSDVRHDEYTRSHGYLYGAPHADDSQPHSSNGDEI